MLAGAGIYTIGTAESHSHKFDGTNTQWLKAMGVHDDVADQLGKHSLTFGSQAPSAGPSLTDYFQYGNKTEADMVQWLNTLTPDQADHFATALKDAHNQWGDTSTQQKVADMNQYLSDNGIKPPFDLPANVKPDELNPLTPYRWEYKYAVTPF
jgi:ribosomal protein S15P/S13E